VATVGDIVGMMPKALQARFNSLGGYVAAVIEEAGPKDPPLDKEYVQFIQLAALVYALDAFFRAGTHAARSASTAFEALGAQGFTVGATHFTSTGENTLRGERLADALRDAITDDQLRALIASSRTMRDLVRDLAWRRTRDGNMGRAG
jgi:hypothetical protein